MCKILSALLIAASFGRLLVGALAIRAPSPAYDYIVVGGGTSGLVVANRLSENANVSVLIIEAGDSVYDNPNVTNVNGYGKLFGTSIDGQYKTVPQTFGNNDVQTLHAAKALGGTSTINGMAYTRAEAAQIDAWEAIGNAGWNWESLFPYYLKSEGYQAPTAEQIAAGGATFDAQYHGFKGPLGVGYPKNQAVDAFPSILAESYQAMGLPPVKDVNGGSMRGFTVYPKTVDTAANVRCDAARAYYWPIATSRKNLHLSLNSTVTRVLWKSSSGPNGEAVASAVEVLAANGTNITIKASREIILSAGALRTPSLLELSGVGNPQILSKAGIATKVALPGVGEHLIDQINNGLTFAQAPNRTFTGAAGYAGYPNATDIFGNATAALAASVSSALPAYASALAARNNNCTSAADMLALLRVQHALLFDAQVPVAEVISWPDDAAKTIGSQYWGTLPFARGSVHVVAGASAGSRAPPVAVDPGYFMFDYDGRVQVAVARWVRRLFAATAPAAGAAAGRETWPGAGTVPEGAGEDEAWARWLRRTYRGKYHVQSTAVMMPRGMGGVVDERLRVYGTANVRVVDASVVPFQVCGHLMSTLYAVAERASDLIKEDGGM